MNYIFYKTKNAAWAKGSIFKISVSGVEVYPFLVYVFFDGLLQRIWINWFLGWLLDVFGFRLDSWLIDIVKVLPVMTLCNFSLPIKL